MPIYEYQCQRCGAKEGVYYNSYQEMLTAPVERCDKDGSRMERVMSAPAFSVKGFSAANNYGVKS
jgi:putative FmdB family regulatory protein